MGRRGGCTDTIRTRKPVNRRFSRRKARARRGGSGRGGRGRGIRRGLGPLRYQTRRRRDNVPARNNGGPNRNPWFRISSSSFLLSTRRTRLGTGVVCLEPRPYRRRGGRKAMPESVDYLTNSSVFTSAWANRPAAFHPARKHAHAEAPRY